MPRDCRYERLVCVLVVSSVVRMTDITLSIPPYPWRAARGNGPNDQTLFKAVMDYHPIIGDRTSQVEGVQSHAILMQALALYLLRLIPSGNAFIKCE
jgi:hypothetical protein